MGKKSKKITNKENFKNFIQSPPKDLTFKETAWFMVIPGKKKTLTWQKRGGGGNGQLYRSKTFEALKVVHISMHRGSRTWTLRLIFRRSCITRRLPRHLTHLRQVVLACQRSIHRRGQTLSPNDVRKFYLFNFENLFNSVKSKPESVTTFSFFNRLMKPLFWVK